MSDTHARQSLTRADTPAQLENRAQNAALLRYVDSMRTHGHRAAHIDPLDLLQRTEVAALDPARYGLARGMRYPLDGIVWTDAEEATLEDVEAHMRAVYVGRVAFEFMHCPDKGERLWFARTLEAAQRERVDGRERVWEQLARSEVFDHFMQAKFPNLKRYGLEGAEAMIPALDTLFARAAECTSLTEFAAC